MNIEPYDEADLAVPVDELPARRETERMMWTLEEAIALVRELEPLAIKHGYHLALGGSVLMAGQSNKDLDLFLYPHKTTECDDEIKVITAMGICFIEEKYHATYGDDKTVFECRIRDKRVDIFCLQ